MKKLFNFLLLAILIVSNHSFSQTPLIDVWDFGAEQLDPTIYNNQLTVSTINSWYSPSITPGSVSTSNTLPTSWTAGILSWTGGSNDRLRTTNTAITRYDNNIASAVGYTGRIYVNAAAATGRYLSLNLNEDDEVTLVTRTDAGGKINFVYSTPAIQTDVFNVTDLTSLKFVAKNAGVYKIYDTQGKPSYFRIYRKAATYQTFTGNLDLTDAPGLPSDCKVVFTNAAGKSWTLPVVSNAYSAVLPSGYTYTVTLADANGYVITSGKTIEVTPTTTSHDLVLKKVTLYTISGAINGLGSTLTNLGLVFTPITPSAYVPEPTINKTAGTYSVQLEDGFTYTISATGFNDYQLVDNTVTVSGADAVKDLNFTPKTKYNVNITTTGLTPDQIAKLSLTFTNINEPGYVYTFAQTDSKTLRTGTYTVTSSGLDEYPLTQALTSYLKVQDADVSKTISYNRVTNWSFDDKVITSTTAYYKGMQLTGNNANEIAKGHLTSKPGATISVPIQPGEKMIVTYYYTADFSIDGGPAITTATNSTNILEKTEYVYPGATDGFVTISVGSGASTTYITDITTDVIVPFASDIYVGTDKTYKTINEALTAISKMNRPSNQRVTVWIDPGNYEEMLVINSPNVTLKNASGMPSIGILNQGVDIDGNAVRITSYYGHGYNYYSMATNQKWNADVLRVNKENGSQPYTNTGAGTTNGSYWNATVVVSASGFKAENIIFENSFNQYISKKESEDVVVEWTSGGKGLRPTNVGNTAVQNKSFVERAAAIAITNNTDTVVLNNCRVIGRQDSFYGGTGVRVVVFKGALMGSTDFLFGPMTAVFYKTDLVMNTSEVNTDVCYITAAQQTSGRGYLMYECTITSAIPGAETASVYRSKPGYFGRPWAASTSEVVFYNTKIETTNFPGSEGQSLINPAGWLNTLSGESNKMYEYGTNELSGVNNSSSRVSWSTVLTTPTLTDGTPITTFNFTKGTDNWDPIPSLIISSVKKASSNVSFTVTNFNNGVFVSDLKPNTMVSIYATDGRMLQSRVVNTNNYFETGKGLWMVKVSSEEGSRVVKVLVP